MKEVLSEQIPNSSGLDEVSSEPSLRSYRAPWKGGLLLACGKCQKKLKHGKHKGHLTKLKKALKKEAGDGEQDFPLHVLQVSCMKLCPKGGITVCTEQQMQRKECSIVRTRADVKALIGQLIGRLIDQRKQAS